MVEEVDHACLKRVVTPKRGQLDLQAVVILELADGQSSAFWLITSEIVVRESFSTSLG